MRESTDRAARTAAHSLELIEHYTRQTAHACVAIAAMLALLTALVLYGAWEYVRIRSAVSHAQSQLASDLDRMKMARPGSLLTPLRTPNER